VHGEKDSTSIRIPQQKKHAIGIRRYFSGGLLATALTAP
jgi:hypothetical protein